MVYTRVNYEVRRRDTFPEAALVSILKDTAEKNGLRGNITCL